jgi:hypothetical protein
MRQNKLLFGLVGLIVLTGTGVGVAISGVSSSAPHATEFVCADGERLLVANDGDTLRVRTGAGVFGLNAADAGTRFQSPFMQVRLGADELELSRPELNAKVRCTRLSDAT